MKKKDNKGIEKILEDFKMFSSSPAFNFRDENNFVPIFHTNTNKNNTPSTSSANNNKQNEKNKTEEDGFNPPKNRASPIPPFISNALQGFYSSATSLLGITSEKNSPRSQQTGSNSSIVTKTPTLNKPVETVHEKTTGTTPTKPFPLIPKEEGEEINFGLVSPPSKKNENFIFGNYELDKKESEESSSSLFPQPVFSSSPTSPFSPPSGKSAFIPVIHDTSDLGNNSSLSSSKESSNSFSPIPIVSKPINNFTSVPPLSFSPSSSLSTSIPSPLSGRESDSHSFYPSQTPKLDPISTSFQLDSIHQSLEVKTPINLIGQNSAFSLLSPKRNSKDSDLNKSDSPTLPIPYLNDKMWCLGMTCKKNPTKVMKDCYKVLKKIGFVWKVISKWQCRCKFSDSFDPSNKISNQNQSPNAKSSIPVLFQKLKTQCKNKIEFKMNIQLYQVSQGTYFLDFKLLDGQFSQFFLVCSNIINKISEKN